MTSSSDDQTTTAMDIHSYPKWAIDPVTRKVMTCPVTIRAPCEHVVDKSSFMDWIHRGNTVCPVCYTPMTQVAAVPDKEWRERIRFELHYNEKAPDMNVSLHLDALVLEDPKKQPSDPRVRLSQSEQIISSATTAGKDPKRLQSKAEHKGRRTTPANSPPTRRPKAGHFTLNRNPPKVIKTSSDIYKLRSHRTVLRTVHGNSSPPTTPSSKPGFYQAFKHNWTGGSPRPKIPVLKTKTVIP